MSQTNGSIILKSS